MVTPYRSVRAGRQSRQGVGHAVTARASGPETPGPLRTSTSVPGLSPEMTNSWGQTGFRNDVDPAVVNQSATVLISLAAAGAVAPPSALEASKSWIGEPGITVLIACL